MLDAMADIPKSKQGPSKKPAFRRHPSRFLNDPHRAASAVVEHLDSTTGRFDLISLRSDPARITASDLVAVSMLGVPVPAPSAAWILGDEGQWLSTEILADIPADDQLWDCPATSILRAADLFRLLRAPTSAVPPAEPNQPALGQAAASRILASKRPRIVPIDDRQMRDALRYSKNALWFRRWQDTLGTELLTAARTARHLAAKERPAAVNLSELRVIDIVVRRRSKPRKR